MIQRKEILRYLLIFFCICILTVIPWASVFGIQDPGLSGAIREFQRIVFFVTVTPLVLKIVYDIYMKPLAQEMKEEEAKEADRKDGKPLLFKPTTGVSVLFLIFIAMPLFSIISQFTPDKEDIGLTIAITGVGIFFIWIWYNVPVFVFTEDSVQIKSHPLYLLGIDRKTVIRYADISSVSPDPAMKGTLWGVDARHRMVISTIGTQKIYGLVFYNSDIIAKIYLRFREKLGDEVTLE
ncbi:MULTISPECIES: hypothetical protein [unclassified Methanoregula]|uniref:hypothetical protein n=1 Tax=unclassified Methanoregula TaxID=2649730 RepID=UPI0009D01844|nr:MULTISPECIES: hypothetical protein [unclassified Methanoregula]OPX63867.1 MAG: hypothetical protein A4E33_01396 [Methanoregula sp. PtaB.Bin085]OPY35420.1 MAG: hypothetical protein A4E34_00694 [Methanoregula sp. PtaU1.Bin006]